MGQVSGAALRGVALPELQSGSVTPEDRARTQAVASAVRVINEAGIAGSGRQVTFSTDSATKTLVVQLVDKESKQVLLQWPSEYALQMAQEYQKEYLKENESLL